jgi:hypothetical protein
MEPFNETKYSVFDFFSPENVHLIIPAFKLSWEKVENEKKKMMKDKK